MKTIYRVHQVCYKANTPHRSSQNASEQDAWHSWIAQAVHQKVGQNLYTHTRAKAEKWQSEESDVYQIKLGFWAFSFVVYFKFGMYRNIMNVYNLSPGR